MKKSNVNVSISRRDLFPAIAGLGAATLLARRMMANAAEPKAADLAAQLAALEARHGGRLGVQIFDTGSDRRQGNRMDERFLMCSTFKMLLAAFMLRRADAGEDRMDRTLPVTAGDMLNNSPVTEDKVGTDMTIAALCHATVTTSDNAAANILLRASGGPEALTAFLRSIGDEVTRCDRIEPQMNEAFGAADTTTPDAIATTMQKLLLGDALTSVSRETLTGWMKATVTGPDRLRAGLPKDWAIGHKTGTGEDGPTNDLAIAWPPGRAPVIITTFYDRTGHTMEQNAAVLAEVGRLATRSL